jgi:hypothetical protein
VKGTCVQWSPLTVDRTGEFQLTGTYMLFIHLSFATSFNGFYGRLMGKIRLH